MIKRNKDGTIEGVATMGDFVKNKELTEEEKKIKEVKEKFEKKYKKSTVK